MTNDQILHQAIKIYGDDQQIDKCIEEMAELTKALLKDRYDNFNDTLCKEVRSEIADVKIMIRQMEMIFGGCAEEEKFKVNRLKERMGI